MVSIAVLIACHNRKAKTLSCLDALMQQLGLENIFKFQVYIVDDGSTDGTSDEIKKYYNNVNILFGNGNLFWNGGMYLAWSAASRKDYDFYLWLNDDTVLFPNAIINLLAKSNETERKAIICGTTRSIYREYPTYGGKLINKGIIIPKGILEECDMINGNCVLVSREIFSIVGNLDPLFTHAIGDYDYGFRARKLGIKSYIPGVYIGYCEKHESLAKWCSPDYSLRERIKAFKYPLAINPKQYFIYEYRHFGLKVAIKHFITIHIRLLFPSLWV